MIGFWRTSNDFRPPASVTIAAPLSVEPSSTTVIWSGGKVWANTRSSEPAMNRGPLNSVMTAEILGLVAIMPVSHVRVTLPVSQIFLSVLHVWAF